MGNLSRRGFVGAAAAASVAMPGVVRAQAAYPSRPVSMLCPWGAGAARTRPSASSRN